MKLKCKEYYCNDTRKKEKDKNKYLSRVDTSELEYSQRNKVSVVINSNNEVIALLSINLPISTTSCLLFDYLLRQMLHKSYLQIAKADRIGDCQLHSVIKSYFNEDL